ncbi:hypothetical protein NP493_512g01001 [Ridgeia piscesae]|uniref:Receptor ligand binding region domain-containing protein n=1 Tax=Ridgeia piscesae TaxID=27915 RepID=A0AAD9KXG7_RIDPI|nr:hypothetical protein NP493_512g01001 [Ridgeia piscesae]
MAELLSRIAICCIALSASGDIIDVGVILPMKGDYAWIYPKTGPGITYAVETIAARPDILAGHTLRVNYGDSNCSDTDGPLVAIDMYIKQKTHVFVGPACEYAIAPIARFSPHWNVPIITGGALVHAFSDKRQYSLLTRIGGSYAKLGEFVESLFRQFGWRGAGLIYHSNIGTKIAQGRTACYFIMEAIYLSLQSLNKNIWYKAFDQTETAEAGSANFSSILKEASKNVRSKRLFSSHYLALTPPSPPCRGAGDSVKFICR